VRLVSAGSSPEGDDAGRMLSQSSGDRVEDGSSRKRRRDFKVAQATASTIALEPLLLGKKLWRDKLGIDRMAQNGWKPLSETQAS